MAENLELGDDVRVGPGMLLRKARERAQLSVHDISATLHLDVRTVSALERDAFDELPAPTFVRGYLRGYARLLGVPVTPVMEAYDREGFRPPDLVADIAEKPQARTGDLPVRLLTYLISGVLVALVVWWWFDRETSVREDLPLASTSAPEATSGAEVDSPAPADPGTTPLVLPAAPAEDGNATAATPALPLDLDSRVESELQAVERTLAQTEPDPPPSASPGEEAGAAGDVTPTPGAAAPADGDTTAAAAEAPPAGDASAQAEAIPAGARGELELRFPIEAWVEIYDRDGERLFFNLVKPGRVLKLGGATPIRVLLGRSRGVTLSYNGEPVDLAPHIRKGGVAQLTLGR